MKNNLKKMERKVTKYLREKYPGGIIKKEYNREGTYVRPDYAVFLENKIVYVELKGNCDSLTRLDGQVSKYFNYCDELLVVLDQKYPQNKVIELSKKGCGVLVFKDDKLDTTFQYCKFIPENSHKLYELLTVEQLNQILSNFTNCKFKSMEDKRFLLRHLFTHYELREMTIAFKYSEFSKEKLKLRVKNKDFYKFLIEEFVKNFTSDDSGYLDINYKKYFGIDRN